MTDLISIRNAFVRTSPGGRALLSRSTQFASQPNKPFCNTNIPSFLVLASDRFQRYFPQNTKMFFFTGAPGILLLGGGDC